MDWARILAYVTGTVVQELLARHGYLAAGTAPNVIRVWSKNRNGQETIELGGVG